MFGSSGGSTMTTLITLGVVAVIIVLRNSRPRELKIDRLWMLPLVYLVLMGAALYEAPPPLTALSISLLAGAFVIGAAIGWQRARFISIHIHPETQALTSRASPIGILFIFAILALRIGARDLLAGNALMLHLPVVAIGDAFVVLAIAMLSVQRVEVWRRATRMLAEAQSGQGPARTT